MELLRIFWSGITVRARAIAVAAAVIVRATGRGLRYSVKAETVKGAACDAPRSGNLGPGSGLSRKFRAVF